MELVYVLDNGGNRVLPITHIDSVRDDNGNPLSSLLPETMVASGTNHAGGLVPDTPNTAGTTKFLREDGTWSIPNGYESKTASENGTDVSLVTTGEKYIWNAKTSNEGTVTGVTVGTGGTNYTPTNGVVTIPAYPTTLPASDVSAWAKANSKPSYTYSEVDYTVNATTSAGGTLSLAGTTPLHVVTLTGNVSALTLSSNPSAGHSCHVILTAAAEQTVVIAHDATNRVCPGAEDVSLTIPAGGYVEIDFLTANSKVYVRCV